MCSTIRSVLFGLLIALLLFFPACREDTPANELIVSAAASLKEAFNEIAQLNEQRNNVKVHFNFGASGALQKQIESGAPVDVFASAGAKQMDQLAAKDLIIASSRSDFARNVLVLVKLQAFSFGCFGRNADHRSDWTRSWLVVC